ncbi:hypothetical protein [Achromobacter sp. 2789STDY5608628]|uniref:hypothetical protein n=1 Tax=Achromobacter sp. 2789STDY5608628 TaxID=1806493 RepID=UPI0006C6D4F7|nr:hypothetical protein [Achromobacter sp. 2789STDY5608628]CUJ67374.1 Uncharacterised protein [Achromobacter sp. 2789STDY5608628]
MRIPVGDFGSAVARPASAVPISADAYGAQQGASLAQTGQGLQQVGAELGRYQQDLNRIKSIRAMAEAKNSLYGLEDEITQGIFKGDIDPADAQKVWQDRSPKLVADRLQGVNSEHRELVSAQLLDTSNSLAGRVRDAATKRTQQNIGGELTALGSELEREAVRDRAGANAKYETSVRSMGPQAGMTPAQIETAVQKFKESSANTVAYTALHAARNNGQALNEFENRLASDEFADLDPQRRAVLLNTASGYKATLEQRAQLQTDRALARGQSALDQVDKQIASGVPAKANDWLQWMAQAAGTPYERDMIERMKSEQEVQDALQKPIGEQVAMVRNKQAAQMSQGANLTDQANLRRLTDAVQTNIKTLSDSPLQYAKNRAGVAVQPLDVGALLQPDGAAVIGAQVRDRVNTINALREANPGLVQMHPLLPDEAKILADVLKNAPSGQKSAVLGTLYHAFGNSQAYDGAMNQLKDTDPFMARMGLRASSYAQSQITNNWFSPDVVQSAGDVAAIALHGDEILRSGGKNGTVSYPIPKDQEFMTAIQGRVGNLYRGSGPGDSGAQQFMQDAYAIKAYYVGRAAQEGDTSGAVDGSRMEQAITAVLGKQVDFHGNGQVLAPWGMNESDFTARATKALSDMFKAAGIQDKVSAHMGNVGLIGVGGGVYFPTLAGTPLADDQGRPLVIRLTPDADTGRDTFGRPLSSQIPVGSAPPAPKGLVEAGNIDLNARPVVRNQDGSISTVRSMSFEEDGKEVLIPTVADDGSAILSDDDAIAQYHRTGKFLGKFKTPRDADAYAQQLHEQQAKEYGGR